MSYLEKAQELYSMIGQGQSQAALDKFYHDNVVVLDGPMEPRNGKEAQRGAVEYWEKSVKEVHGGGVNAIAANEENGITTVESWMDITFQDGSRRKMEEVAIQQWEGDKIIRERFYYDATGMTNA